MKNDHLKMHPDDPETYYQTPLESSSWYNDAQFPPIRTKDLSDNVERLIEIFNNLTSRNIELKEEIERLEKEKTILTSPISFSSEMSKVQLACDTYTDSLRDIEVLAEKSLTMMAELA